MVAMFIDTFQYVVGSFSYNFVDIVIIGERIELGLENGKIVHDSSTVRNPKMSRFNSRKKKGRRSSNNIIPYWGGRTNPRYRQNYQSFTSQFLYVAMSSYQTHQQGPPKHQISYQAPLVPNNAYQPKQGWKSEADLNSN